MQYNYVLICNYKARKLVFNYLYFNISKYFTSIQYFITLILQLVCHNNIIYCIIFYNQIGLVTNAYKT